MKTHLVLLICCYFLLTIACDNNSQSYHIAKLNETKQFYLKGPSEEIPLNFSVHNTDSGRYMFISFIHPNMMKYSNSDIYIYNLNKKKRIDTIPVGQNLRSFYYKSPDSLFVFYRPKKKPHPMHDSIFLRVNTEGDTLDTYSFATTPAICGQKETNPDSVFIVQDNNQQLKIHDDKVFFIFEHYKSQNMGDSAFKNTDIPLGGHFDLKERKFEPHKGIQYPFLKPGNYYPFEYKNVYIEIGHNGNPIYSFSHTPLIFEYDMQTGQIKEYYIKSLLADTVKAFKTKEEANEQFPYLSQAIYGEIHYDKTNQRYIRQVFLPSHSITNIKMSAIIFDTSYNVLAEGKNLWTSAFSNNHIYNYEYKKNKKDSVCFSINTMGYKPAKKQDILNFFETSKHKHDKKEDIYTYFTREMNIEEKTFTAIIIPSFACSACADTGLKFYEMSYDFLSKNSVYMILAVSDSTIRNSYLKEIRLNEKTEKLLIDRNETYMQYHDKEDYGCRLVMVKNDAIVHDKVYLPNEMEQMQLKVLLDIDPAFLTKSKKQ